MASLPGMSMEIRKIQPCVCVALFVFGCSGGNCVLFVFSSFINRTKMAEGQDTPGGEINLDKTCRTCLEESDSLKSIFLSDENFGATSISALVTSCTQLKVCLTPY